MMKTLKILSIILMLIYMGSCDDNDELTQEQELQNISKLFTEIENLTANIPCDNADEWRFTSYGSKACGGAMGYMAYSINIDTVLFLNKIEEHRKLQQAYNDKWGIISDCSIPSQPQGVICENGSPVLEY